MAAASLVVLGFLAYSFLGWVVEGVVVAWCEHRLKNPGFLAGPVVPIYGIGALGILAVTAGFRDQPVLVFLAAAAVATVVEFVGHWLLEKLLGLVLWDYSGRFGNIQGRVCLGNSMAFGAAGVGVVYVLDPLLSGLLAQFNPLLTISVASGLGALVLADWVHAVLVVVRVRPEIEAIRGTLDEVRAHLEEQLETASGQWQDRVTRQRVRALRGSRRALIRLGRAFPAARGGLASGRWLRHDGDQEPDRAAREGGHIQLGSGVGAAATMERSHARDGFVQQHDRQRDLPDRHLYDAVGDHRRHED